MTLRHFLVTVMLLVLIAREGKGDDKPPEFIDDSEIATRHFEVMGYPLRARLKGISGVVVVKVDVDEGGRVMNSSAISGPRELVAECVANARKWRFSSARRHAVLVYRFVISGLCHLPCSSHFEFYPPNLAEIRTGLPVITHSAKDAP